MSDRTVCRITSVNGWLTFLGKRHGRSNKKSGSAVHDDLCTVTDEYNCASRSRPGSNAPPVTRLRYMGIQGSHTPDGQTERRRSPLWWLLSSVVGTAAVLTAVLLLWGPAIGSVFFGKDDPTRTTFAGSEPASPPPSDDSDFQPTPLFPSMPDQVVAPTPPPAPEPEHREVQPAPTAPICPTGAVSIIYSQMQLDGTAWAAGVIRNDSDTLVRVIGVPGAWGVDSQGKNVVPVGGYFQGPVDRLYSGDFAEFKITSAPLTEAELSSVVAWKYTGDGDYLSARWLAESECPTSAPIVVRIMD